MPRLTTTTFHLTADEQAAKVRRAKRVGCSQGELLRVALARLDGVPDEEIKRQAVALPNFRSGQRDGGRK